MSSNPEYCAGCGHPLSKHYKAVDEHIYCMVVHSGTSDRGVIGLPWTNECDCKDYASEKVRVKEEARKKEQEEHNVVFEEIARVAKQKLEEERNRVNAGDTPIAGDL